jgi:hypothetical protein
VCQSRADISIKQKDDETHAAGDARTGMGAGDRRINTDTYRREDATGAIDRRDAGETGSKRTGAETGAADRHATADRVAARERNETGGIGSAAAD